MKRDLRPLGDRKELQRLPDGLLNIVRVTTTPRMNYPDMLYIRQAMAGRPVRTHQFC